MEERINEKNISIEVAIIDEITGDNLHELLIESSEIVLDTFLEDGVLKEIPIFGVLYKSSKAILGIRENIFAKKIYKFLIQLNQVDQLDRKVFIDKINGDGEYKNKVGEKLIILIDQLDDMDKPEVIGNLFVASIKEQITFEEFLRLSSIVQKAFLPDIKRLADGRSFISKDIEEQFVNLGIFNFKVEDDRNQVRMSWGNDKSKSKFIPKIEYKINSYGEMLLKFGLKQ